MKQIYMSYFIINYGVLVFFLRCFQNRLFLMNSFRLIEEFLRVNNFLIKHYCIKLKEYYVN